MITNSAIQVRTRALFAAFLLLTPLACQNKDAGKKKPEIVRIEKLTGPGFSMKVPEGYVHRPDILKRIGETDDKVLWKENPGDYPNPYPGGIIVATVPTAAGLPPEKTFEPLDDPEYCLRELLSMPLKGISKTPGPLPPGAVCQVRGEDTEDKPHIVISTLMKQPGKNAAWILVCTHDPRDVDGPSECARAVEGWEFIP